MEIKTDQLTTICRVAFPDQQVRAIESINPMPSNQHLVVAFWLVTDQGKQPLILRRYPSPLGWAALKDPHKADREAALLKWLAEQGMPVPQVIASGKDADGSWVLQQAVKGRGWWLPLGAVNFNAVLPGLARQQVDLLIRLHTLDAATVPADAHLLTVTAAGLVETYRDIIKTEDAYVATALERVAALFKDVKERPPRLIHFDAELENLLVGDDGQVAAWIDWDEAALGDPGWDVAALLLSIHGAYSMPDLAARAVSDYARVTVRPLKDIYCWASALASIRWAHCAWLRMQRELQHKYEFPSCDRFIEAYDSHSALAVEMLKLAEEKSR